MRDTAIMSELVTSFPKYDENWLHYSESLIFIFWSVALFVMLIEEVSQCKKVWECVNKFSLGIDKQHQTIGLTCKPPFDSEKIN